MTQSSKNPHIDTIGTYTVTEPIQKINPRDDVSYEVPRGEYPVMGLISDDGTQVKQVGIVLSAPDPDHGSLIDIIELLRPLDIPAMVQRREMTLTTLPNKTFKFPLDMFIPRTQIDQMKQPTQSITQASVPTQSATQIPLPEQRAHKALSP